MKLSITPPQTEIYITIHHSPARSPGTPIAPELLEHATRLHVQDVQSVIDFMIQRLTDIKMKHDFTKFEKMADLHRGYETGFKDDAFWSYHKTHERHHLDPSFDDVNLLDILENIADGVAAGMGRTGKVYEFEFTPELLALAVKNTSHLLMRHAKVIPAPTLPAKE